MPGSLALTPLTRTAPGPVAESGPGNGLNPDAINIRVLNAAEEMAAMRHEFLERNSHAAHVEEGMANCHRALSIATAAMQLAHTKDFSNPLNRLAVANIALSGLTMLGSKWHVDQMLDAVENLKVPFQTVWDPIRMGALGVGLASAAYLLQNDDELALNDAHPKVAIASLAAGGVAALLSLSRYISAMRN